MNDKQSIKRVKPTMMEVCEKCLVDIDPNTRAVKKSRGHGTEAKWWHLSCYK